MTYSLEELNRLRDFYRRQLLSDTIPFWFPRSFDHEHGGFLLMRDADGSLIDDDKGVWIQARAVWMLATLYNTVEQRPEWLEGARLGMEFLDKHCFDTDGRMFFHMTRDGRPIRKRRYYFSETFYVIAAAAWSKATGDMTARDRAIAVFERCVEYATVPGLLEPKFTETRPAKGIGVPMIMINTAQELRANTGYHRCDELIGAWITEIERDFVKDDIKCVMEQVAPDGSIIDHIDGRTLNPGHAIEGAWFILNEARHRRNDPRLIALGCRMLDYMWPRGWDEQYGGILYFRDVYGKPVQEYWQDMKFWWPHNEAIIATLMAYLLTGDEKYAGWHRMVHDYSYDHFHDRVHGEWFGYLHRDGTIAQTAKGNMFKCTFHLPRQEWLCEALLTEKLATSDTMYAENLMS
jgi:N-acylglucosamine 2-epimerase